MIQCQRRQRNHRDYGDSKKSACESAGANKKSQSAEQAEIHIQRANIPEMERIGLACQRVLAPIVRVTANPVRETVSVRRRNT